MFSSYSHCVPRCLRDTNGDICKTPVWPTPVQPFVHIKSGNTALFCVRDILNNFMLCVCLNLQNCNQLQSRFSVSVKRAAIMGHRSGCIGRL